MAQHNPTRFLEHDLPQNGILALDLVIPDMDGIEVIRCPAEKAVDLRLILISGFDSRVLHSAQQLAEAQHIKVLATPTKPIAIQEFVMVLNGIEVDAGRGTGQSGARHDTVSAGVIIAQAQRCTVPAMDIKPDPARHVLRGMPPH